MLIGTKQIPGMSKMSVPKFHLCFHWWIILRNILNYSNNSCEQMLFEFQLKLDTYSLWMRRLHLIMLHCWVTSQESMCSKRFPYSKWLDIYRRRQRKLPFSSSSYRIKTSILSDISRYSFCFYKKKKKILLTLSYYVESNSVNIYNERQRQREWEMGERERER